MATLKNSIRGRFKELVLSGNSTQLSTTGKNLFDLEKAKKADSYETVSVGGVEYKAIIYNVTPNTDYTLSVSWKASGTISNLNIANTTTRYSLITSGITSRTVNSLDSGLIYVFFSEGRVESNIEVFDKQYFDIQLETGKARTSYEPYTGGQPSPNSEYPQEIKSVGKYIEDSGKYEVNLHVLTKNLLPNISSYWKLNTTTSWGAGSKYDPIVLASKKDQALTFINVKPNTKYSFLNLNKKDIWVYRLIERDSKGRGLVNHALYGNDTLNKETYSFTTHKETKSIIFQIKKVDNTDYTSEDIEKIPVMFYEGENSSYEPYTEQTVQIALDEPLRSVGDYKDEITKDGIVRRIKRVLFDGSKKFIENTDPATVNFKRYQSSVPTINTYYKRFTTTDKFSWYSAGNLKVVGQTTHGKSFWVQVPEEQYPDAETFNTWLSQNHLTVDYVLAEPVIEPLPESMQQQLRNLHSYNGTTNIIIDSGEVPCGIDVTYKNKK